MEETAGNKSILFDEREGIKNEKNRVLLSKLNPIIYDEEEFIYLSVGEKVGDAFKAGAEMIKEFRRTE